MRTIPFDIGDAALLIAAGYTHEFVAAHWEDVGGPESGPKLAGNPDADIYTLEVSPTKLHVIVVCDGEVVQAEYEPALSHVAERPCEVFGYVAPTFVTEGAGTPIGVTAL